MPVTNYPNEPMVMLVTSRGAGRWIIPKGRPKKGVAPHRLAELEAWEEAGLLGRIGRTPIGRFIHPKQRARGGTVDREIEVFRLDVTCELADWPEKGQRQRCWYTLPEAIKKVGAHSLATLLRRLADASSDDRALHGKALNSQVRRDPRDDDPSLKAGPSLRHLSALPGIDKTGNKSALLPA